MYFDLDNAKFRKTFIKELKNHFGFINLTDGNFLEIEYSVEIARKSRSEFGWSSSTDRMWMQVDMIITGKFTEQSQVIYTLLREADVRIVSRYSQCKSQINDFVVNHCPRLFDYSPKFAMEDPGAQDQPKNPIFIVRIHGRETKMIRTYTLSSASNDIYVTDSATDTWDYMPVKFTNPSGT